MQISQVATNLRGGFGSQGGKKSEKILHDYSKLIVGLAKQLLAGKKKQQKLVGDGELYVLYSSPAA